MAAVKTPLPYLGGKQKLARRIVSMLPETHLYCEPFSGMASVYLAKEPVSKVNILNDQDELVVHFLRMVRDRPDELPRWIERTPWSRAEYEACLAQDHPDPVVRAGQTAMVCIMSMVSNPYSKPHDFATKKVSMSANQTRIRPAIEAASEKLLQAQFESKPALSLIRDIAYRDDVLLYCDPPYLSDGSNKYRLSLSETEHDELLETLTTVKGKVAISGYPSKLYMLRLADWNRVEWHQKTDMSKGKKRKTEVLWLNF